MRSGIRTHVLASNYSDTACTVSVTAKPSGHATQTVQHSNKTLQRNHSLNSIIIFIRQCSTYNSELDMQSESPRSWVHVLGYQTQWHQQHDVWHQQWEFLSLVQYQSRHNSLDKHKRTPIVNHYLHISKLSVSTTAKQSAGKKSSKKTSSNLRR